MAKRIKISDDDGATSYTFPGSKGEMTREGNPINDTILGQIFKSDQTGLISWGVNTNGVYKGFAGYKVTLKKSGSSTVMTDEATTLISGKTYQISNSAKRVMNRAVAVVVEDNGSPVSAVNIESIDYLFGRVTFVGGYTVNGAVTITGAYLPMSTIAKANSYTLTQTTNPIDNSVFEVVQANEGYRTYEAGLKTVSLALKGVYDSSNAFEDLLEDRAECVIEINPDGTGASIARGWFKPMMTGQQGDVGELEEQSLNFSLSVPDQEDVIYPFAWLHTSTTLNTSLQKALTAWQDGTLIDVFYLPDGTNGFTGDAIVTDVTLSGGLETMNDFNVKFQGCGQPVAEP